jgi:hypothetical protein
MGITDLLFKRQKLQVGTSIGIPSFPLPALIEFDASVSETYTDETEVMGFPVEDGSEISDHIRKLPVSIEINGVISNTPIVFLASVQANLPKSSPIVQDLKPTLDRVETGYAQLRAFQDAGILVDVVTGLRSYWNMALTSISVSRDANTGNILNSTLTLREVKIAQAMSIDLPTPQDKGNEKKKNKGKKQPKKAETAPAEGGNVSASANFADKVTETLSAVTGMLG